MKCNRHLPKRGVSRMNWTPKFEEEFQNALMAAFINYNGLNQLAYFDFSQQLNRIAPSGTLVDAAGALVQWAKSVAKLDDLLTAARARNPGNPELKALEQKLQKATADAATAAVQP